MMRGAIPNPGAASPRPCRVRPVVLERQLRDLARRPAVRTVIWPGTPARPLLESRNSFRGSPDQRRSTVRMTTRAVLAGLLATLIAVPASAQTVKIGFITTLSGPQGVIGEHMKSSVELAL